MDGGADPDTISASGGTLSTTEFNQVVGVYERDYDASNNDRLTLYVNGTEVDTVSTTSIGVTNFNNWDGGDEGGFASIGNSLAQGDPGDNTGTGYEGEIAIFRFYDSALSDAEALANFNHILGLPTASGTIVNDDTAVLSIDDVSEQEDGTFTFTITSSNASDTDITGTIDTADILGEAVAGPGLDYTAIAGATFTITGNSLDKTDTVTVTVNDDAIVEDDETFNVNLSDAKFGGATDATRATFTGGEDQGLGTIEDNDNRVGEHRQRQ